MIKTKKVKKQLLSELHIPEVNSWLCIIKNYCISDLPQFPSYNQKDLHEEAMLKVLTSLIDTLMKV